MHSCWHNGIYIKMSTYVKNKIIRHYKLKSGEKLRKYKKNAITLKGTFSGNFMKTFL